MEQLKLPFTSSIHVLALGQWHFSEDCPGFPHCSMEGKPPVKGPHPFNHDDRELVGVFD